VTAPLRGLIRQGESEGKPPLLLLLHGYGSNEEDLFSLESAFDPRFTVVSARAPMTLGPGSYAWFPLAFSEEGPVVLDSAQAEASRERVVEQIGWCVAELGTDPERVVLAGFSQGAILSAAVALTCPELVRATVWMSGRVLPESARNAAPRHPGPEILVVHGVRDTVLPIAHGRATHTTLDRLGIRHEYQEFDMGHQISDESLDLVTAWVARF